MRRTLRPWAAIGAGVVAVAGLTGFVHTTADRPAPAPDQTITYELTGERPTTGEVRYGDVAGLFYSPWTATSLPRVSLPWHVTVPLTAPLSVNDLQAWAGDDHSTITCTVRRNGEVVSTSTAAGGAYCDTPPG